MVVGTAVVVAVVVVVGGAQSEILNFQTILLSNTFRQHPFQSPIPRPTTHLPTQCLLPSVKIDFSVRIAFERAVFGSYWHLDELLLCFRFL